MMYTVYILRCHDGSLYTGITNDLPKRWALHQAGKASRYTRSHPVKDIVYTQHCRTKGSALKREIQIKQLHRTDKLNLIHSSTHTAMAKGNNAHKKEAKKKKKAK